MDKPRFLKSTNDFVIGAVLLVLGLWVLFTKSIVTGNVVTNNSGGGIWVRPDMYVRLIGGLLAFFSLVLMIKAINFTKSADTTGIQFVLSREVVYTTVALIVYVFILSRIGFAVSTFLLTSFLACLYIRKERSGEGKPPMTKHEIKRDLIIVAVYSVVMDVAVYFLFTRVLHVALP